MNPQPTEREDRKCWKWEKIGCKSGFGTREAMIAHFIAYCRYGGAGDRLWVKETFQHVGNLLAISPKYCRYRADGEEQPVGPWKPSIFMPRWASRIMLEITGVRVERLQDISKSDCIAEGMTGLEDVHAGWHQSYAQLWDSINAKKHPWNINPWVWVISFNKIGG